MLSRVQRCTVAGSWYRRWAGCARKNSSVIGKAYSCCTASAVQSWRTSPVASTAVIPKPRSITSTGRSRHQSPWQPLPPGVHLGMPRGVLLASVVAFVAGQSVQAAPMSIRLHGEQVDIHAEGVPLVQVLNGVAWEAKMTI